MLESDERIAESRNRCGQCRDLLVELVKVHLEIDAPTRSMEADEPDWIGRMRKVLLHVMAINHWEIEAGVEHVIAPEIRAAYEQLHTVWKCLPLTERLDEVDVGWWAHEARSSLLATYDHPTSQQLMSPVEHGGFSTGESRIVYGRLIFWFGRLMLGYGLGLCHLSRVLGSEEDIVSRVTSLSQRMAELTTLESSMNNGGR